MRSVVVAKYVPWPPNSGDKRRTLGLVRALAQRGPVTVCAYAGTDEDPDGLRASGVDVRVVPWVRPRRRRVGALLAGLARGRSLTSARFYDGALARAVAGAVEGGGRDGGPAGGPPADVLVVEHVQLLPLAPPAGGPGGRPAGGGRAPRRVVDMHNVESLLASRIAASATGARRLVFAVESRALRSLERRAARSADVVAVVSDVDAVALDDVLTHPRVVVVPNAWDAPAPLPAAPEPVASFVALQSWGPNVDAATWFARSVWPLVLDRVPAARLQLVGRNPAEAVRALAGPSVVVSGTVADLAPWYERTRVALAPLRAGGGSRLKILEALAAGRPVVATTVGAEGLEDLVGRGVVVADDPAELARAVADLLDDPARSHELGLAGARAVGEDHSWSAAVRPLLAALDET